MNESYSCLYNPENFQNVCIFFNMQDMIRFLLRVVKKKTIEVTVLIFFTTTKLVKYEINAPKAS